MYIYSHTHTLTLSIQLEREAEEEIKRKELEIQVAAKEVVSVSNFILSNLSLCYLLVIFRHFAPSWHSLGYLLNLSYFLVGFWFSVYPLMTLVLSFILSISHLSWLILCYFLSYLFALLYLGFLLKKYYSTFPSSST